jgi:hypothetical protein
LRQIAANGAPKFDAVFILRQAQDDTDSSAPSAEGAQP